MKFEIPILYEAIIVPPRCRKPRFVLVRDVLTVGIEERSASALPVAFRFSETEMYRYSGRVRTAELRWDGERLWDLAFSFGVAGQDRVPISAQAVADDVRRASINKPPTTYNPFFEFWRSAPEFYRLHIPGTSSGLPRARLDDGMAKAEIQYREWHSDNRDQVVQLAQTYAARLRVVDGMVWCEAQEPRYYVITFGMGHNHGLGRGTHLSVSQDYNENLRFYFRADELNDAIACATKIATDRGDTKALPMKPDETIEVLIPEAVRLDPQVEHGPRDCS